ncbi:MAG: hypothetical protein ACI9V8_000862 [Urechidicola sp.]
MFSDTAKGAQGSATCYSLIETVKANGLVLYEYLHPILKYIAAALEYKKTSTDWVERVGWFIGAYRTDVITSPHQQYATVYFRESENQRLLCLQERKGSAV